MPQPISEELANRVESCEAAAFADCYRAAPPDFAAQCGVCLEEIGPARLLLMTELDNDFYNRVVGLGIGQPAAEEEIDRLIELARRAGRDRILFNVSPKARPAAVHGWLLERGAFPIHNWIKLYRGDEMPPFVPTDLRVEQVGMEWAEAFGWLSAAVFGIPEELQPFSAAAVGRPGWVHYLAFDGDFPVACGAMYCHGDTAWLGFGGTLETHRRRGAQGSILTARIYAGLQRGCRWFVSDTSDFTPDSPNPSFKNLTRLGFQTAYLRPNYMLYL